MALSSSPKALQALSVSAAALLLTACGTMQPTETAGADKNDYRDAIGVYSNPTGEVGKDPVAAAAFWGTRYNRDHSDATVAVRFSQALRKIGSTGEAVDVMTKTASMHQDDVDVSLEYGKVLVESGRAFEAVRHLENAVAKQPGNWNALSAYGVALDQIGEHHEARRHYDRALGVAPNSITVLNNKGMSYALDGNLSMAKTTLRQAAASAGSNARIRQNLALVLAISGDLQSAERLARSDLPPQLADNNIEYFRQLMNQPAYWGEYAASDADVPAFDAAPLKGPIPDTPSLQEEPKPADKNAETGPTALFEVAPITNVSVSEDTTEEEKAE